MDFGGECGGTGVAGGVGVAAGLPDHRTFDIGVGTPGLYGELADECAGAAELFDRQEGVPEVGLAGDVGDGSLLAGAADQDRDLAHRWWQ
jgi:hypothetical protein